MTTEPFVIERTFDVPQTKVWQAITDNEKMKKWYFDIDSFEARVGHKFSFSGGSDDVTYIHLCEVTVVEPEHKLAYSWVYKDYEGSSEVTFELFPEGEETRLRLTHTGLDTFPKNSKDFAPESFAAGWTYIIGTSLKDFLSQ